VQSRIDKVLVLGHTGFIGSRLLEHLRRAQPQAEVVGRAPAAFDLTEAAATESLSGILTPSTAVVMCSAMKRQFGDTLDVYGQNVAMVANLCRALALRPAARVVYFSSAAVYGEDIHNVAITEETCVQPRSYYGAAKFAGECLLRKQAEAAPATSLVCLRPPLVYGPGDAGDTYGPSGFVRKAARGETVTLWGDGTELREFLFIDDLVEIVVRLAFGDFSGVLNVANGRSHSFREALDIAARLSGRELLAGSRARSKRSVDNVFDNARLRSFFPAFSSLPLEEGMRRTFEAERGALASPRQTQGRPS